MNGDKPDGSMKAIPPVSLFRGVYDRVAKRLGVDPSYVSRVARGERKSAAVEKALAEEVRAIRDHLNNHDGQFGGHDGNHNGNHNGNHDGNHDNFRNHEGTAKRDGAAKNVDSDARSARTKKSRAKNTTESLHES
jgi:transcriptional regulator with XRE-family HTH domain